MIRSRTYEKSVLWPINSSGGRSLDSALIDQRKRLFMEKILARNPSFTGNARLTTSSHDTTGCYEIFTKLFTVSIRFLEAQLISTKI